MILPQEYHKQYNDHIGDFHRKLGRLPAENQQKQTEEPARVRDVGNQDRTRLLARNTTTSGLVLGIHNVASRCLSPLSERAGGRERESTLTDIAQPRAKTEHRMRCVSKTSSNALFQSPHTPRGLIKGAQPAQCTGRSAPTGCGCLHLALGITRKAHHFTCKHRQEAPPSLLPLLVQRRDRIAEGLGWILRDLDSQLCGAFHVMCRCPHSG